MSRLATLILVTVPFVALWQLVPGEVEPAGGAGGEHAVAPGPGEIVVDLVDGSEAEVVAAVASLLGTELRWSSPVSEDEALVTGTVDDVGAALALLEGRPEVEAAEPVILMEALGFPDDPMYPDQWNFHRIGAPVGWRAGGGRGVRVAVLDTGITLVPDLAGTRMGEGRSFVPGADRPLDDHGHGTHVAGTIAQATHNGLGVAGLAPQATLVPYKVLARDGTGRSDWIAAAVDAAVDDGADVINLSLGGSHSEILHLAVEKAAAAGVVVVAAAGNTGREGVSCPAHARNVLGVGAVGPGDARAPYSSWGDGVDLVAPGGDTSQPGGGVTQETVDGRGGHTFASWQGTSMASPHVAGAAAVLLSAGAGDADHVRDLLLSSTLDLGAPGQDPEHGHGRLDLAAAVTRLQVRERGVAFGAAALLAWVLAARGRFRPGGRLVAAAVAAVGAGGLFFLPLLPGGPVPGGALLSRGLIHWAPALGSPALVVPAVASCLPALVAAGLMGLGRLAPVALGLCGALAVGLAQVALLQAPGGVGGTAWVAVNAAVSLLLAMAVAGVARADRRQG